MIGKMGFRGRFLKVLDEDKNSDAEKEKDDKTDKDERMSNNPHNRTDSKTSGVFDKADDIDKQESKAGE